jgi:hypothetical protein
MEIIITGQVAVVEQIIIMVVVMVVLVEAEVVVFVLLRAQQELVVVVQKIVEHLAQLHLALMVVLEEQILEAVEVAVYLVILLVLVVKADQV